MGYAELNGKYRCLRSELDAAYAVPVWNSSRIDEIAKQIVQVEFLLASAQHPDSRSGESQRRSTADGGPDAASQAVA